MNFAKPCLQLATQSQYFLLNLYVYLLKWQPEAVRITTGPTELGMPSDEYNESHGGKGVPLTVRLHPSLHGDLIIILVPRHLELIDIFKLDQSTGFDFHGKKIVLVWGWSESQRCCQPPALSLYYIGKMKETIFPKTSCAYKGQQQLATW